MKFSEMPYERVDHEELKKEFNNLFTNFAKAETGEEQFEAHKYYYHIMKNYETMSTIAMIRHDINIKEEFYAGEQDYYDTMSPQIDHLINQYMKMVYDSEHRDYLESKIGPVAFKNIELRLKSFDEKLIPLIQKENALSTMYNKLIASANIKFHGEELNISLLRKYLISEDREIRRQAHEKESEFFLSIEEALDEIYDELVKNRTEQAKLLGYNNFVELAYYRMERNCYDQKMVKVFRDQVKEYLVPFAEKLHERRRERIGLSSLSYIDEEVHFKNGNPAPIGTPEQILLAGKAMYTELSSETKDFFHFMMSNELFDVFGRKDKRAGGYQTTIPNYNAPFIFANFNTTSGDVDVMTHECGHAFQAFLVRNEEIREHKEITMETAECHSMSMEFFTRPWMHLFFGERANEYIQMHLEHSVFFIPYGCMVDEFQQIVYENPNMSPQERKDKWMELEKVYRPHLNYENDPFFGKGGRWQKQTHIYNSPFYYIDYCLAMTCALQYKVMMDEDYGKAWNSYLNLCKASASDFFVNTIKTAGLISPFDKDCIKSLVDKLEEIV